MSVSNRAVGIAAAVVLLQAVLAGAAVLTGLGVLSGDGGGGVGRYLASAAALGLLTLAVTGTIAGLGALIGRPGLGLGVVIVFLLANPVSAVAAAPELLPRPWGAIGQLLPPGAGGTLLRSTAFFGGAGSAAPLWTLVAWAVAGLAMLVLGRSTVTGHGRSTVTDPAAAAPAPTGRVAPRAVVTTGSG